LRDEHPGIPDFLVVTRENCFVLPDYQSVWPESISFSRHHRFITSPCHSISLPHNSISPDYDDLNQHYHYFSQANKNILPHYKNGMPETNYRIARRLFRA
jgi:hypothetical protein